MTRGKIKAKVSISYFDFDFGDEVQAADAFARVARATLTDQIRCIELNVNYLPIHEEEEEEEEEKEEEEQEDDQTTD